MRPPVAAEVVILARCLVRLPQGNRAVFAASLLAEVDISARHLGRTGRLHPQFGDGSIMARCHSLSPPAEPAAVDGDFLQCLIVASAALLLHLPP